MSEEQIRAEFEAWYRDKFCKTLSGMAADEMMYIGSNGEYSSFHVRGAWEGWQAALSAKSVPDGSFMDLEDSDYVAKRFRLILSKLGISTPESDEELLLGAFSYLGMARRALEDILTAPQPPTDKRVRELEKDAARYRWLRNKANLYAKKSDPMVCLHPLDNQILIDGSELDEAIDQAMK